jgi:hypothetical protein
MWNKTHSANTPQTRSQILPAREQKVYTCNGNRSGEIRPASKPSNARQPTGHRCQTSSNQDLKSHHRREPWPLGHGISRNVHPGFSRGHSSTH